jgi:parallel beta-helix repeat protein
MNRTSASSPQSFLLRTAVLLFAAVSATVTPQPALAATTLVVAKDGPTSATDCNASQNADQIANQPVYSSIQAAVNAAPAGSTILVCPGTYAEQVVVTKNNLRIEGAGHGLTLLRPSALPVDPGSPETGAPRKAILLVNGATGVTVSKLTIDGSAADGGLSNLPSCRVVGFTLGIYYRNSSGTVDSTHTTNVQSATRCSAGIFADSGVSGATNLKLTGNTVDKYGKNGVVCSLQNTACTMTGNTLTGLGPVGLSQGGITIRAGAAAQVTENTVRGHVCTNPSCGPDPINQDQSVGIIVEFGGRGSHISGNRVAHNDVGIYQYAAANCCTISENRVTNNRFFGIIIQDGNGTTSENKISGGQVGVGVVAAAENTVGVLRGDEIRDTSVARVKEIECCGFKATAIVKAN